ncbi:5-oxoprolinase subunit PxpA [Paraglaciecola sp.]|uniref:5-oxoprolinase subunit PxpA n=1 Tax=Paraglaciecola sp. TaxID=1920173 RepID=UPI00273DB04A|nr:5-oxoprolinase subunit PxpA [Paraglaciecola sp.]MDP5031122.1 LamB/YcsF family protein [Paraglaciecola sp.]
MTTLIRSVDINCDLGEGLTIADCEQDALLMPFLSRCNIACGGHAGNHVTMPITLRNALSHGLLCGAHPGYPDKNHFGRVSLNIARSELLDSLVTQIKDLQLHAQALGIELQHIKLHGALYNDAEQSLELASHICQMVAQHFAQLAVLGLPQAAMQQAAQQHGLLFLAEGFMDRAYLSTGQLAPRTQAGAVYTDSEQCIEQVLAILNQRLVTTFDGKQLQLEVDTLCLHGDSQIALHLASTLQDRLSAKNWIIA